MSFTNFVQSLSNPLEPWEYEAYVHNSALDPVFIGEILKTRLTQKSIRAETNKRFGKVSIPEQKNTNEVSEAEFKRDYQFGLYPNVLGWVSHFNTQHNKLLTREKLYEYILANPVPKAMSR